MKQKFSSAVVSLVIPLAVVFAVRSSLFEPFKIPSGSMLPTLYVGDFVLVNKFAYGFHVPFTDLVGAKTTLVERSPPARGDVIVFEYPDDRSVHYIKRVIGTPGDSVEIRGETVCVNGTRFEATNADPALRERKMREGGGNAPFASEGDPRGESLLHERIGEREHLVWASARPAPGAGFGPITVPAGKLFVLGDNRDHSSDSRVWGFVPLENVTGRAERIWFSMWINFAQASESAFHPERIGTRLD